MHLSYCEPGPNETARSLRYDGFEVLADFNEGVIWILGRAGEEWSEVASLEQFDGKLKVNSWESGELDLSDVNAVFIDGD